MNNENHSTSTPTLFTQQERSGSKHKKHRVRLASLMSYAEIRPTLSKRNRQVFEAVLSGGPATDREVKLRLGFDDMNMVRPRITSLLEEGYLNEIAQVRCEKTNRLVRLVGLSKEVKVDTHP